MYKLIFFISALIQH